MTSMGGGQGLRYASHSQLLPTARGTAAPHARADTPLADCGPWRTHTKAQEKSKNKGEQKKRIKNKE